jgi:hypothetical protein
MAPVEKWVFAAVAEEGMKVPAKEAGKHVPIAVLRHPFLVLVSACSSLLRFGSSAAVGDVRMSDVGSLTAVY